jgi:hypothetical protein
LSEHALFEVADIASAAGLATRLAERWSVVVSAERPDTFCVVAELRRNPDDVAVLLREVEAWVERESALALRFEVDGRAYVLEAGEPDWSTNVAAARPPPLSPGHDRPGLVGAQGSGAQCGADPRPRRPPPGHLTGSAPRRRIALTGR